MVKVSRLNGAEFYVNPDLIEFIEQTPDTLLTMTAGKKVIIKESPEELADRILQHKQEIFSDLPKKMQK
jgi:flagellar protein FlbD